MDGGLARGSFYLHLHSPAQKIMPGRQATRRAARRARETISREEDAPAHAREADLPATHTFCLRADGSIFEDVTTSQRVAWLVAMHPETGPVAGIWTAVPSDLLPDGCAVAYFNTHQFMIEIEPELADLPWQERGPCEMPACEVSAKATPCCHRRLCMRCCLGVTRACLCEAEPKFQFTCPMCRACVVVSDSMIMLAMSEHCPDHAKLMESKCPTPRQTVVTHHACSSGCYACADSRLVVTPL